ncbi:hypothetical protein JX265_006320 [Neoarthrinium moseri]|uniref:Uncharacterized protein n=1 Tax=Neoarthrinium moseri TaxID=1658444 RepID=A0A9P9WLZ7_9PEZI|nr:hypothetical protein JX265_006320 [Neoarthrinium moseri]
MSYTNVWDAIPQLANLSYLPPDGTRAPNLGGQNFTHCCLRAVNSSLTAENGSITFTNTSFFLPDQTIDPILESAENDDFPCGAEWNGDPAGSPVVQVPYRWCTSECSGWEISHFGALQQWVGPLVQFILPSLAFCLNIPRTRKLAIPDVVFQAHPRNIIGFTTYWIRLGGAMIIMTIDTFVWLALCFAFAGPMLLSGVYEFVLDRKILEFLSPPQKSEDRPKIPARLKAQLLLAVIVGNLRISTGIQEHRASLQMRQNSYGLFNSKRGEDRTEADLGEGGPTDNTWHRVVSMLDDLERQNLPSQLRVGTVSVADKLKSVLMSQASFGSTVGAPILFFVGGFIYTVLDISNSLGDNDQAHALAFGMWWMTIPYLAIMACAMLASNSPSALQGLVYDGGTRASREKHELSFWDQLKIKLKSHRFAKALISRARGYELIEHTYEGNFQTVTMWNRGPNKRRWVHEAIREYARDHAAYNEEKLITPDQVRQGLRMSFGDKRNIILGTLYLLITPSLLAFLTSYNTPRKSLSCRTMTYLVYGISQICEMLLWIWEAYLKVKYGPRWSHTKTPAKAINWWGQVFVGFFAVLAAVGGTFMQMLGVYRSCACRIPAKYWMTPDDPDAYIVLSTNTAESIVAAQNWWTVTGTVAVVLLSVICSLSWWHQRRLRKVFREEADTLEEDGGTFQLQLRGISNSITTSGPTSPTHQLDKISEL